MINIINHDNSNIKVFSYKNQKTLQVVGVENAFSNLANFVKDEPFKKIIELGSDYGGLTNLLADNPISDHAIIHTFDINNSNFKSYSNKIKFYHTSFDKAYDTIVSLITSPERTLLLCDGGNKPLEFKTFYKYLKQNDIIMAHDYAPNKTIFQQMYLNKIWNWHEFQDEDANYPLLEPFLQDQFSQYVWCIRIKK